MLQRLLFDAVQSDSLRDIPLFAGLSEKEKEVVFKGGRFCVCPRKKPLYRQGDSVTHFYIITSGTVRLFHETPDGCEITTDILTSGSTLGETEIFQFYNTHRSHAMAVDNVTALEFPKTWLEDVMKEHLAVLRNMLSGLSMQISLREAEAERQVTMTSTQLVGCFLRHMAAARGAHDDGFDLPYSKSLIATRLGMALETFSRCLVKLKDLGITVKGRRVHFHNTQATEEKLCAQCSFKEFCTAYRALGKL